MALVKDRGRGFDVASFDPRQNPDPLADHGRGLFIIASLMDSLELRLDGGLEVHMARRAEPRCEPASLEIGVGHKDARARATLEEIEEAFFALDWQYHHVYVNDMALRFTQKSREELLGRAPWDSLPQLRGSLLMERYREAMELGKPSVFEHRSVVSGQWLEVRVYPTSTGISAYYREIEERKRIEQEVVATRAELAATLAAITDGFYTLDRQMAGDLSERQGSGGLSRGQGRTRRQLLGAVPGGRRQRLRRQEAPRHGAGRGLRVRILLPASGYLVRRARLPECRRHHGPLHRHRRTQARRG